MRIKAPFSYYGGKSKIAHVYPRPQYGLIIEPFAGSAAYSWRHREGHDVWVNDLDPRTHAIWRFLTRSDALAQVHQWVPDTVTAGTKVLDLVLEELADDGLIELMRSEANQGTQGAKGVHDQITKMGAKCWKLRRKMEQVIPAVSTWHVTNLDYKELPDVEATWFVDPPYSNIAGGRYRTGSGLDYGELADWVRSRKGQVIVCENAGANWLPFRPLEHRRVSIRSRYHKADAREVMWTNEGGVDAKDLEPESGRKENS
jgi:hypothetical protein